jgi:uncharacterized protein YcbX
MPHLERVFIYPIKSLDGVARLSATVLASGALQGDREFAIVDSEGNFVNGKRTAKMHGLRSIFDLENRKISLRIQGTTQTEAFHLEGDRSLLEAWLSDYFSFPVRLIQNIEVGFPDDTESPGPTIVSIATLQAIATWFPDMRLDAARLRFRTNLEINGVDAFWEDCLYGEADSIVPFQIGDVQINGVNPCQRCIVPTRDAITGEATTGFQKTFVNRRKETLPEWVERSRFNHFYRLAINTRIPQSQAGKVLTSGDEVRL